MLFFVKITLAVVVFALVAELSKSSPRWGGLISAIPWITILVIVTRHQLEQAPASDIVDYLMATFWFILPTLVFIGVMAGMLHRGSSFYIALAASLVAAAIGNCVVAFSFAAFK
jgi:F0F1-type ATP synthase assembly protein I